MNTIKLLTLCAVCAFSATTFADKLENSALEKEDVATKTSNAEKEVSNLEEFEVQGMRFGDALFDLPLSAQNISARQIAESNLASVPEALRSLANIYTRNSAGSNPSTAEVSMRGFGENSSQRVLFLVDGQRINRLDMAITNWSQIPLEQIDNIEILRGPQSALYGNYAVGGVIKITTKRWNQPDTASLGGFFGSYGEYNASGRVAHSGEDFYVSANLNYYHNSGFQDYSLTWNKSAGVNAGMKLDEKNEIHFFVSGGDEFIQWPLPFSSYEDMKKNPSGSTLNWEDNMNYVTMSSSWENKSSFGEGGIQLGANMREKDVFSSFWSPSSSLWTVSAAPRYRVYLDEENGSHIEGGVDIYYDNFSIKAHSNGFTSEVERTTAAPWLAGAFKINETFSLIAGGRFETAFNDASSRGTNPYNADESVNGMAAQIGINAKINESWNVYFRFDQLYRYPSIDEMFSIWGSSFTETNLNLKPERGQNYEIGTNFVRENWRVNFNLFFMHLDDEIGSITTPTFTYRNINIGSTDRFGSELNIAYDFKYAGFSSAWTFVSAEFSSGEYDGNSVPLVPSIVSSTRVWVQPVEFCRIELCYQWASEQFMGGDFYNDYKKMPAFWTLDLNANFFINKNMRAFIGFGNITGETYATSSYVSAYGQSWYPGAGRTVRVGVEFKF